MVTDNPMHPRITITCAFTRLWAIERWIKCLDNAVHDPELTSLVFVVDADEPHIKWLLSEYAKSKPYASVDIIVNEHNAPNELRIAQRRHRIAEVKNQTKPLIATNYSDYVIGLEDDTVFGERDLMRLLEPFAHHGKELGFVEGVQCGRWGVKIIGAWRVNDYNNPTRARTIMPPAEVKHFDLEKIDGGGFYGYATPKDLYLGHDYYSAMTQPYGPDVNYGLWLRAQGYDCLIDWSIVFGHNDRDKIIMPDEKVATIEFNKVGSTGHWKRKDVEPA